MGHTSWPLEAKCKALLVALQTVWFKGYRKIIFEGDCQILVSSVNGVHEELSVLNLCKDINTWEMKLEDI